MSEAPSSWIKDSPLTCPSQAPAGLKYNRGYRTRFWLRPEIMSFRRLFAVHFAPMLDGVHRTAFQVVGHLGAFEFNWLDPQHANTLLVSSSFSNHSRQLFGNLLAESAGEWLLSNDRSGQAAKNCPDADYVAQRCHYDHSIKGTSGVYFISNGNGAVKVGKSRKCIGSRFADIQVSNPDALRVVAVIATPDPTALEARLQNHLSSKRIRGEWYAISDAEAITIATENGGKKLESLSS